MVRTVTRHAAFLIKMHTFCGVSHIELAKTVLGRAHSACFILTCIRPEPFFIFPLRPSVGETAHPTRDPRAQLGQNRPENPKLRPIPRAARKNEKNTFGTFHFAPDAKIRGQKAPTVRTWCLAQSSSKGGVGSTLWCLFYYYYY